MSFQPGIHTMHRNAVLLWIGLSVALRLYLVPAQALAQPASYDLVIRNGRVVDGTGNPWYEGDIGIRGDIIARIAPTIDDPATRVIDAAGKVVTPGFIDIH